MRNVVRSVVLGMLVALVGALPATASLVAPPSNLGELARISEAVVFAEAEGSRSELRGETPYTITEFRVLREVAGAKVPARIEVEEAGGEVGEIGMVVAGGPVFENGARYLLFLDRAEDRRWRSKMLSYGILRESEPGVLSPLAQAAGLEEVSRPGVEPVGSYRRDELLSRLAAVAAGAASWQRELVAAPAPEPAAASSELTAVGAPLHTAPASCGFLRTGSNVPLRWFGFERGTATAGVWHTTPGQTGIADGGASAVQQGAAAWTDHDASAIKLQYLGSRARTSSCATGDAHALNQEVVFDDPCSQVPDLATCSGPLPPGWSSVCCGQVAIYRTFYNSGSVQTHDGEAWQPIQGFSVIVNNGSQCVGETDFKELVTHFLGHGLGFNHHSDSQATMYQELGVHPSRGAALGATDKTCAAYSYHTFVDVPRAYWAWSQIEGIENEGITVGCEPGKYCAESPVTRAQIAVFLLRGIHGGGFQPPPASGTVFSDVPASYWAAASIEKMAADGLTKGCGNGKYCPETTLTRAEMAVFLLRAKHGANYVPPPGTGTMFTDVPPGYWALDWIEQLAEEGITTGCEPTKYCPNNGVTRAQMAVFLVRTLGLAVP